MFSLALVGCIIDKLTKIGWVYLKNNSYWFEYNRIVIQANTKVVAQLAVKWLPPFFNPILSANLTVSLCRGVQVLYSRCLLVCLWFASSVCLEIYIYLPSLLFTIRQDKVCTNRVPQLVFRFSMSLLIEGRAIMYERYNLPACSIG